MVPSRCGQMEGGRKRPLVALCGLLCETLLPSGIEVEEKNVTVPCDLLFSPFSGFVVGHAGLLQALAMLLVAYIILALTVLSVCAIATNGAVRGGGAYCILQHRWTGSGLFCLPGLGRGQYLLKTGQMLMIGEQQEAMVKVTSTVFILVPLSGLLTRLSAF